MTSLSAEKSRGNMKFDAKWADKKLDMTRRRLELERHINLMLPELRTMNPGLVVDVGPGPGDFLALCRDMDHSILGIDAPHGKGGMGDPYLRLCKQYWKEMKIPVICCGLGAFIDSQDYQDVAMIHLRGSIEQASAHRMEGPPHDEHHECKKLDWIVDQFTWLWFQTMFESFARMLRRGGMVFIHANGTKSTNKWYDQTVRQCAAQAGLRLVYSDGLLIHKWVK